MSAWDYLNYPDDLKATVGIEGEDGTPGECIRSTRAIPPGQVFLVTRIASKVSSPYPTVAPLPRVNVYKGKVALENFIDGTPDGRLWCSSAAPVRLGAGQFLVWNWLDLPAGSSAKCTGTAYGFWIKR